MYIIKSFFQVYWTKKMIWIKYLLIRYYYRPLIVRFHHLQLLKIKKAQIILNSQMILIFMIKSIQIKQNKKIISKWKIQLMNILKINLKKLKIQIINYLIMIFYCKIIMICQIMNFPMKKIKKYNIVIFPNNKKVH